MASISSTTGHTFTNGETNITHTKLNNIVNNASISISSIDTADISDSAITADKIAVGTITDAKLAQITTADKVATSAVTDGDIDLAEVTADALILEEGSAITTPAGAMSLYTKDTSGQPELFCREESDGDEIQLTNAGAVKGIPTTLQVTGTSDITTSGTSYADMTDMELTLTGAGTYIFTFNAPIKIHQSGSSTVSLALDIDGTDVIEQVYGGYSMNTENPVGRVSTSIHWIATITTETTAKVQWKHGTNTATQYGTDSPRVFSFVKIG